MPIILRRITEQVKTQNWFAGGISEEILNALTRVEGLAVASRTSAFQFKGRDQRPSHLVRYLRSAADGRERLPNPGRSSRYHPGRGVLPWLAGVTRTFGETRRGGDSA